MLKYLPEVTFTVITNSIEIAGYLREYKNIDTYLIGGKVKPSGNITDTLASELISRFSIDLYFLQVEAFHYRLVPQHLKLLILVKE